MLIEFYKSTQEYTPLALSLTELMCKCVMDTGLNDLDIELYDYNRWRTFYSFNANDIAKAIAKAIDNVETNVILCTELVEAKAREELKIFTLPFLLTLILIGYTLIEGFNYSSNILYFLIMVWGLFFIFYSFKDKGKLGKLARKLIECCKRW